MPRPEDLPASHGIALDASGGHARSRGVPRRRESAVRSPREDARAREALTVVDVETMVAGSGRRCSGSRAHRLLRDAHARSEADGHSDRWLDGDEPSRSRRAGNGQRPKTHATPKDSRPRRRLSAGAISTTRRWRRSRGRVNWHPSSATIREAQEDVAMEWIRNVRVENDKTSFGEAIKPALAVVDAALPSAMVSASCRSAGASGVGDLPLVARRRSATESGRNVSRSPVDRSRESLRQRDAGALAALPGSRRCRHGGEAL